MAKIIKHTFKIPCIQLDQNGDLVEGKIIEETYTFTLLSRGIGIYEEMTGRSLFSDILAINESDQNAMVSKLMDRGFILNLASASYVKIENGKFHNNRGTAEEFKKLPVANHITDFGFLQKLIEMATECIAGKAEKGNKEFIKKKSSKPQKK